MINPNEYNYNTAKDQFLGNMYRIVRSISQYGNLRIFLYLRFYVKSSLVNPKPQKLWKQEKSLISTQCICELLQTQYLMLT